MHSISKPCGCQRKVAGLQGGRVRYGKLVRSPRVTSKPARVFVYYALEVGYTIFHAERLTGNATYSEF